MKATAKLHRVMSIIAAIAMIFSLISSFFTLATTVSGIMRSDSFTTFLFYLLTQVAGFAATVFSITVLFRGKKDLIAGVLMFLTALVPLITIGSMIITFISSSLPNFYRLYLMLCMLADVICLGFRICLGIECIFCGSMSRGFGKLLLVGLPLFTCFFDAISKTVLILNNYQGADFATILIPLISAALPMLLSCIPSLLMGIAFAIPVREQIPAAE